MSAPQARPLTPSMAVGLIVLVAGCAVFLGGLFIGMEIDPRVDMRGRLIAYSVGLGGFAAAMAGRWTLATRPLERKACAAITALSVVLALLYANFWLRPYL